MDNIGSNNITNVQVDASGNSVQFETFVYPTSASGSGNDGGADNENLDDNGENML